MDGRKHALGCWIQDTEGAKFWQKVLADLRNRGVKDVLVACCDGLTGLPDAMRAVFPDTVVQTCVVQSLQSAGCASTSPRRIPRMPTPHAASTATATRAISCVFPET